MATIVERAVQRDTCGYPDALKQSLPHQSFLTRPFECQGIAKIWNERP